MIRLIKFSSILVVALIAVGLLSGRSDPSDDAKPAFDRTTENLVSSITDQFSLEAAAPHPAEPDMVATSPQVKAHRRLAVAGVTPQPEVIRAELLPPRSDKLIAIRTGLKFADPASVFAVENRKETPVREPGTNDIPAENAPLWKVTASRLNVRTGPSANDAAIGAITRGTVVAVIGSELSGWLPIRATEPELEGYVAQRFLAPADN
ncbi:SH3 domain-containing protein [Defluviimonas sp. WL0050]|uniref:SH3 domain-containing protein n=1 Tax=Albidovulum litorale TaxID=2984134 RepID=A0ABT2ZM86_9RHOB|nr:SH3 domain-containing protein [Defluviimonas sp. WL0050]MCV2872248.1 SH3 domain-containing protein [Defluviimonas sp. WL0050]